MTITITTPNGLEPVDALVGPPNDTQIVAQLPPMIVWHDRERSLGFTWSGYFNRPVVVTDGSPDGPKIDQFMIDSDILHGMEAVGASEILALFMVDVCQAYQPVPPVDRERARLSTTLDLSLKVAEEIDEEGKGALSPQFTASLLQVYIAAQALRAHESKMGNL